MTASSGEQFYFILLQMLPGALQVYYFLLNKKINLIFKFVHVYMSIQPQCFVYVHTHALVYQ